MKGPRMLYPQSSKGAVSCGSFPSVTRRWTLSGRCRVSEGLSFLLHCHDLTGPCPAPAGPACALAVGTACVKGQCAHPAAGRPEQQLLSCTISL